MSSADAVFAANLAAMLAERPDDERRAAPLAARPEPAVLYIKTMTGKTITLSYTEDMTVAQLKERIENKEGIPADQQRLIYRGNQLNDFKMLRAHYNIQSCATIHAILRLCGD